MRLPLLSIFALSHLTLTSALALASTSAPTIRTHRLRLPKNFNPINPINPRATNTPGLPGAGTGDPEYRPIPVPDYVIFVCEHINWEGRCEAMRYGVRNGRCYDLPVDWQGVVSSVRLGDERTEWCRFYKGEGCRGSKFTLEKGGIEEFADLRFGRGEEDFNDRIGSVECWKPEWDLGKPGN